MSATSITHPSKKAAEAAYDAAVLDLKKRALPLAENYIASHLMPAVCATHGDVSSIYQATSVIAALTVAADLLEIGAVEFRRRIQREQKKLSVQQPRR